MREKWGRPFAAVLSVVGLVIGLVVAPADGAAPARPAGGPGDVACGSTSWTDVNGQGLPTAMSYDGWGRCPSAPDALWWARWSYPRYPLLCVPADSPLPAYEFIWVSDAALGRTPLLDQRPGLVDRTVRRAVSVFAASKNAAITSPAGLATATTPRLVTVPGRDGRCRPRFDRVTVPHAVLRREPYQNWTNPATGAVELGLWPWLEQHGYPPTDDRRYITITDSPGVWNFLGGATIVPCEGMAYGAADARPGPENCNQTGGTWMTVSTDNRVQDFDPVSTGSFGERLAHELVHGMGALVEGAPHYNPLNAGHPSDCADLLCYNNIAEDGQHYDACGGAPADSWDAFFSSGANSSRAAYRLDCGRDDYYGFALVDGSVQEKPWTQTRWAGEDDRFFWGGVDGYDGAPFSATAFSIPPECTYDPHGWCPPGVQPVGAARRTAAVQAPVVR